MNVKESLKFAIKHYEIFIPASIGIIIGLIISMLQWYANITVDGQAPILIPIIIAGAMFSYVLYGWTYAFTRHLIVHKKASIKKTFFESFPIALKIFLVTIVLLLLLIPVILVEILPYLLGAALLTIKLYAIAVCVFIVAVTLTIITVVLASSYIYQLTAVLIIENKGVFSTIKTSWMFFIKNIKYSIKIFIKSTLILIALSIPTIIFTISLFGNQEFTSSPQFNIISSLLSIPATLMFTVFFIWWASEYYRKTNIKKTKQ